MAPGGLWGVQQSHRARRQYSNAYCSARLTLLQALHQKEPGTGSKAAVVRESTAYKRVAGFTREVPEKNIFHADLCLCVQSPPEVVISSGTQDINHQSMILPAVPNNAEQRGSNWLNCRPRFIQRQPLAPLLAHSGHSPLGSPRAGSASPARPGPWSRPPWAPKTVKWETLLLQGQALLPASRNEGNYSLGICPASRDFAITPSCRMAAIVVSVLRVSSTPSLDTIASANFVFFRTAPSASR